MKPRASRARWPVVLVAWFKDPDNQDIDAHFDEVIEMGKAGEPFALVMDLRELGTPAAAQRKHAAERMRTAYRELEESLAGVAHVFSSPITRGIVTAIYWLAPAPFPTHVTGDIEDAVRWAQEQVRAASGRS